MNPLLVAFLGLAGDVGQIPVPPPRPNLLVVVTDDQRHDMLGHRHPVLETPHLDRLAERGISFPNAFVTTSICAASRASILTGLTETRHGFTFGTPPLARVFTSSSYPALLRVAGYRTGFVGKFGVKVEKSARDEMFDWYQPLGPPYFKELDGHRRHVTDLTADRAVEFLRDADPDRPFCLTVCFNAPHAEDSNPDQYLWPPSVDALYADVTFPPPPLAEPEFFAGQPAFLRESLGRVRWHWRFDTPDKYQRMVRGYFRMVSGVDAALGRVFAALEAAHLEDDTVIVFTSDNGYFLGDRGLAGKWLPYEASLRVPLIVYDPRKSSTTREVLANALNIDLAPTLLELAGVTVPAGMQGHSLAPWLRGEPGPTRAHFFFEHHFDHAQIPKLVGVRTDRLKYARYYEQEPPYEELYDLRSDPEERHNLAGDPAHASSLGELRELCDRERERLSR